MNNNDPPTYIYLLGPDGVGKTYHTRKLSSQLDRLGHEYDLIWLGYYHIFSIPLLLYAKIFGYTTTKTNEAGDHISQHHFDQSFILSHLYPPILFFDTLLVSLKELIMFKFRKSDGVIFDRFLYDALSQAMVSTGRDDIPQTIFAKLLLKLYPADTTGILLMANESVLRNRRSDVNSDPDLKRKIETYGIIAKKFDLPVVYTNQSKDQVQMEIKNIYEDDY